MRQRCLFILLWVAVSILAGCDKDNNAPRIIAIVPAENAIDAPRQGSLENGPLVKAQFNEALRDSSVPPSSIVLEYNGEDIPGLFAFSPAINTIAFEPIEPLLFLREYTVRIGSGISDLEGNRTTAGAEWLFRVRDGSFGGDGTSDPVILINNTLGTAIEPQITIGPNDHSQIVWTQLDNASQRNNIWAMAWVGKERTIPVPIEDELDTNGNPIADAGDANSPQVAVDSNGNAIAVWSQFDGTNWRILTNRYTHADRTWSGIPGISTISDPGSDAMFPQIAIALDGSAIAVWQQSNRIYASRFTGTWSGAMTIDNGVGTASAPQIAIDSNNNAIAVWAQDNQVFANRYNSGWAGAVAIGNNGGATGTPQIAIDSDGNNVADAIAVWSQSDGTRNNIWANRFNDGGWGITPELLETDSGNAQTPQIAMDSEGRAIAVWAQVVGSRFRILASHFEGGSWNAESEPVDNFSTSTYTVELTEEGVSTEPQIAMDGDGNALVVWTVLDGFDNPVRHIGVNRYRGPVAHSNLQGWPSAAILEIDNESFNGDAKSPAVAVAPDFTAVAVWSKTSKNDGSPFLIQASVFQ